MKTPTEALGPRDVAVGQVWWHVVIHRSARRPYRIVAIDGAEITLDALDDSARVTTDVGALLSTWAIGSSA